MNKLKLRFIGVGGAFAPLTKGHSNMYLESENGKRLLIDCGSSAQFILSHEWGMPHTFFEALYISHLHADHIGSVEWYALAHHFMPADYGKPTLFGHVDVLYEAWEKSLRGGLETLEGHPAELKTYFDVHGVIDNAPFYWEGYKFQPVQVNHVSNGYSFKPAYGLIIVKENEDGEEVGQKTFITTDTQFCPEQLKHMYRICDVIFHDCETTPFRSGVHAHYEDLSTLPEDIRQKMWLYHYADKRDDFEDLGYRGFVDKGQEFMI